jgi:hypothetical protein
MNHAEHDQQTALFQWAEICEYREQLEWMYAVPNAARRSPRQGAWMKKEGMKKGVCDIHLDWPVQNYHGLKIEMKTGKNKLTPEQVKYKERVQKLGYYYAVCYSWIEARDTIVLYLAGERF